MQTTRIAHRRPRGFTLIELMTAVGIVGILSTIAIPSIEGQLQRMRRVDALVSVMHVQLAQERWRSNAPAYATLAQIGIATRSINRHYLLDMPAADATGYEVTASATGAQQRDRACRVLKLTMRDGQPAYRSGSDTMLANDEVTNRRCWHR